MSYPTLAETKICIGKYGSSDDAKIAQFMSWTEELIHVYLGRDLNSAEYTQNSYKLRSETLQLDNYPITSITSITMDDVAQTLTDFHVDLSTGIIYGDFTTCDVLVVVYQGGYSTLPEPIHDVFCSIIEDRYNDYKGLSDDDIKDVTIFDFAKVSFDTGGNTGRSLSYSGVSAKGNVPAVLEPYLGVLNMYKSNIVLLSAPGVNR